MYVDRNINSCIIMDIYTTIFNIYIYRFILPFPVWLNKLLNPQEYKLKKYLKVMDSFAYRVVSDRRKEEDVGSRLDVLSRFICMDVSIYISIYVLSIMVDLAHIDT